MRVAFFLTFLGLVALSSTFPRRTKRQAYSLPDGANLLLADPNIRPSFECSGDGYYADVDNNCQIFHVCHGYDDGSPYAQQFSFVCGNQTVFNQLTFTCSFPEEAVPCDKAPDFFYLNSHVQQGDPEVPFLNDQDVQSAAAFIPGYNTYGSRVSSVQTQPGGPRPIRGGK